MGIKGKINKNLPGLLSPLLYAVIPLIVLIDLGGKDSFGNSFLNGATLTFLKDIWGLPLNIILMFILGQHVNFMKHLKSKVSIYAVIAGIFGGPIGYTLFNTSFYLAGPSYGHVFSSVEPIILVLMVYLLYKRKFNAMILSGVVLTTVSVICLVFGSALTGENASKTIIGSLLAILGSACWAVESLMFDRAFIKKPDADVNTLIIIKMFSALLINISIFIPATSSLVGDVNIGFNKIATCFENKDFIWRLILGGVLLFVGRLCFFKSVDLIGPTISNIFYELSIVITPILSMIIYAITGSYVGHDDQLLDTKYQITFWITSIGTVAGTIMVIIGEKKWSLKR